MQEAMQMIQSRKADHVQICMTKDVKADYDYWDDIQLIHHALPEIGMEDIDTSVRLFGAELSAPLVILAMTGGYPEGRRVNENLARAAERHGIGMGVGSQRAGLEDESLADTYSVIKDYDIPLRIANIGAPQLVPQHGKEPYGPEEAGRALDMIDGHLLAVHMNFLQEVVQPEGDNQAAGCLDAVRELARSLPVLAKETGAGVSGGAAMALKRAGVKGIDIGGLGGTSFSAVEVYRAEDRGNDSQARVGRTFWNWGIPAPVSVVKAQVGLPLIASGGIRNGLDIARALVLGADCGGMANALLAAAWESAEAVDGLLATVIEELRSAMFLMGCSTAKELAKRDCVITGPTRVWMEDMPDDAGFRG
jgi:isopentenyl-diphosphate delta-isomerase